MCLAVGGSVQAADDTALRSFKEGQAAFAAADYPKALTAFESAVAAGMHGPAVHFNIGVAAYRARNFERATAAFKEVARTPAMAALAHYNLGLVALAAGRTDEARDWFSLSQTETDNESLRALSATRLANLSAPPAREWLVYGGAAVGYDDNVALIASSDVLGASGTADGFGEIQLAVSGPDDGPWRLDGGLFLVDYFELDGFDQSGLQAGGYYALPVGRWSNQAGVQLGYTTLDGSGFERGATAVLQTSAVVMTNWELRARLRLAAISGLEEFDGLSGSRYEIGARLRRHMGPWQLELSYRFDDGNYRDAALSAIRHQFGVDVRRDLGANWSGAAQATWRMTDYDQSESGEEHRLELALEANYALTSRWRAIARYAYADNDADQVLYQYSRNRISAGVEAVW